MKQAIIDIGTNSILLLIAQINSDKSFKIIVDECRIVRLGEDMNQNKFFLPQAMQRTIDALKEFRQIIDSQDCSKTTVVGTAAFRNANNQQDFFDLLDKNKLKFKIKVLTGKQEADLIRFAAIKDFKHLKKPLVILDIGGGSTEIMTTDKAELSKLPTQTESTPEGDEDEDDSTAVSFPFGTVNLTEEFLKSDPPSKPEKIALSLYVKKQLGTTLLTFDEQPILIATAGTPTTIGALALKLPHYDSEKVHGQKLSVNKLKFITQHFSNLTFSKRSKIPCLPPKRADVIIAGSIILETVLELFKLNRFWVSDHGLRYGILYKKLK